MPVTIREVTSEVVLGEEVDLADGEAGAAPGEDDLVERVVRKALEHVLERLRMEWER